MSTALMTPVRSAFAEGGAASFPGRQPRLPAADGRPVAPAVYLRGDSVARSDQSRYFGQVEAGLLAAVRTDSRGQEAVVELHGAGATLGESNLLQHTRADTDLTLEAVVPTRVRWIDPSAIRTAPDPALTRAVLAVLATRTRVLHDIACRKRLQNIRQQVAQQLLDLWSETALGSDAPALHHLSHFDLARIVGTNRSVVTKVRSEFRHRGWCTLVNHDLVALDVPALHSFATQGLISLSERPQERLRRRQAALSVLVDQALDAETAGGPTRQAACAAVS